jgi:hypothetical protein
VSGVLRVTTRILGPCGPVRMSVGVCTRKPLDFAFEPADQHAQVVHRILEMHSPFGVHGTRCVCLRYKPLEHLLEMMERLKALISVY